MTDIINSVPQTPASPPQSQRGSGGPARRLPYSPGRRIGYGILWAAWTAVLAITGFAALFSGQILVGLVELALAAVASRYDYQIWTWRARRLLFLIIW